MTGGGRMSRRRFLAAAGTAALGVSACGRASAPSGAPLTWATGAISANGPASAVARLWNDRRLGPPVRVVELPELTDDQHQLFAVELGAGVGNLDILELDVIWVPEFASNGWLVDLGDLSDDVGDVSLRKAVDAGTWNDTLWAAPYTTDAGLLYVRTDLWGNRPIGAWEDLHDHGLAIGRARGVPPFIAAGGLSEGLVVQFLELFWSAGGVVLDPDGALAFPSGPAERALRFLRDGFRDGFYAPGYDATYLEDTRAAFESGGALTMRSWPYAWKSVVDGGLPVQLAPLPAFRSGRGVCALGGHNLAINRWSTNVSAATDFIRFAATDPQVQRMLVEKHSSAPTLASVYDGPSHPVLTAVAAALPTAVARPPLLDWPAVSKEIQLQIDGARQGAIELPVAVDAIRTSLDSSVRSSGG